MSDPTHAADADTERAPTGGKRGASFGGLTPAQAARKRWDERRAAQEALERAERENELPPDASDAERAARVRAALWRKAMAGDHLAARELREWLKLAESEEETPTDERVLSIPLDGLDPSRRAQLMALLGEGRDEAPVNGEDR